MFKGDRGTVALYVHTSLRLLLILSRRLFSMIPRRFLRLTLWPPPPPPASDPGGVMQLQIEKKGLWDRM